MLGSVRGAGPSLQRRAVPTAITVRALVELDAVGVGERSGCPDAVTMGPRPVNANERLHGLTHLRSNRDRRQKRGG